METPGYGLGAKALETVSQWRFDVDPRYFTDERTRIDATSDVAFRCQF